MTVAISSDWLHRLRVAVALILFPLSLYLPILIVDASFRSNFRGLNPNSGTINTVTPHNACIYNGEMWFQQSQRKPEAQSWIYRLQRLNLKTREIRPTEILAEDSIPGLMLMGDQLYAQSFDTLFRIDDFHAVPIGPVALPNKDRVSNFFLYDDRPTVVCRFNKSQFQLYHLQDGEWLEGREIILPELIDKYLAELKQQPESTVDLSFLNPSPTGLEEFRWLTVETTGRNNHLFLHSQIFGVNFTYHAQDCLHREGFQFVTKLDELTSALSPENRQHQPTGWTSLGSAVRLQSSGYGLSIGTAIREPDGMLVAFIGQSPQASALVVRQLLRLHNDGSISEVTGVPAEQFSTLAKDPSDGQVYLISQTSHIWNGIEVHRVEEDVVQPAFFKLSGEEREYVDRWRWSFIGVMTAWISHFLLLAFAAFCVGVGLPMESHHWDNTEATIAPIWRRIAAGTVDLIILLITVQVVWYAVPKFRGDLWSDQDYRTYSDFLVLIRWGAHEAYGGLLTKGEFDPQAISNLQSVWQLLQFNRQTWIACSAAIAILIGTKILLESYCGLTFGKRVFRIRTTNLVMNPPGLLSSLIRSICLLFDDVFLLTPLPAIVLMSLSNANRRIGDHFANTVVIVEGSVRDVDLEASTN